MKAKQLQLLLLSVLVIVIASGVFLLKKQEDSYRQARSQSEIFTGEQEMTKEQQDQYQAELDAVKEQRKQVEAQLDEIDQQLDEFKDIEREVAEKAAEAQKFLENTEK